MLALKLLASFVFSMIFFILTIRIVTRRKNKLELRLKKYLPPASESAGMVERGKENGTQGESRGLVSWLGKRFTGYAFVQKWEYPLSVAGYEIKPEDFFAQSILASLAGFTITYLFDISWFLCVLAAVLGFWIPRVILNRKKRKRLHTCSVQLVDALGTLANAMRAGFSFTQALQMIAKETPEPLGPEFALLLRNTSLGIPLEQVFEQLYRRLPFKDLELVITALIIQRSTGGNLADLLDTLQATIRDRVKIKAEINTLTAQGRMSSWIITLLPVLLGLYLDLVNPTYFHPLVAHPLGWAVLILCGFSILMGWFVIRKVVNIEV